MSTQPDARSLVADHPPAPWPVARASLASAGTYWLSTVRPDGHPHAMPVLGVLVGSALHFAAGDRSRKARNLGSDPRCTVCTHADDLDLVVEGTAAPVDDPDTLVRIADAYGTKYGWQPQVRDGMLWADGAPTAGPPPYRVYRVDPQVAFAFPADGDTVPTRWRFRLRRP